VVYTEFFNEGTASPLKCQKEGLGVLQTGHCDTSEMPTGSVGLFVGGTASPLKCHEIFGIFWVGALPAEGFLAFPSLQTASYNT